MIIERYIHREILVRIIWITCLLFLIFAGNKFVDILADAVAGKIPADMIFKMLWLKMLATQPTMLPLAIFLAVILAYARLSRDNELAILATSGVGKFEQMRIVSRLAVILCLVVAGVNFYVAPWSESRILQLRIDAKKDADISGIAAGKFKEFSKGDRIVYVESISEDKRTMENVFLQIKQQHELGVLTSDTANFDVNEETGHRFIIFENGRRYLGEPGTLDYQITEYEKYGVLIESETDDVVLSKLDATPTSALLVSDLPEHRAELQWRISLVLACILLSLLAVMLNQYSLGQKPYLLLFISILAYFVYSNLLGISKTLLKRDEISSLIGLWWVHLLLILVIIFLYYSPALMQISKGNRKLQVLPANR